MLRLYRHWLQQQRTQMCQLVRQLQIPWSQQPEGLLQSKFDLHLKKMPRQERLQQL
jgi:hypothetical protein